ncbi:hypothetical protein DXG01_003006 [Tephrocybe rancida]|nr:hypothetical protein DXG01_003006 [Tephrocybe rancida]
MTKRNSFYGKTFTQTQQANAAMSLDFEGQTLHVFGSTNGTPTANIDGKVYYSSTAPLPANPAANVASLFILVSLGAGKHTVTITNRDEVAFPYIDYITWTSDIAQKNGTLARLEVDDIDPAFHFQPGAWSTSVSNSSDFFKRSGQLLYFISHLEAGKHTLLVVNQDNAAFDVDSITLDTISNVTTITTLKSISTGGPTNPAPGSTGASRISTGSNVGAAVGVETLGVALPEILEDKDQTAERKDSTPLTLYDGHTAFPHSSGE